MSQNEVSRKYIFHRGILIKRAHYYTILAEGEHTNRGGRSSQGSTVFFLQISHGNGIIISYEYDRLMYLIFFYNHKASKANFGYH